MIAIQMKSSALLVWSVLFWIVLLTVGCVRQVQAAGSCSSADIRVVVGTKAHELTLCERDKEIAVFGIRLGRGGVRKTKEGDGKTPTGIYPLGEPRKSDRFGIFIPIGYPTPEQRQRGYTGGDVGVHGPHRLMRWLGRFVNTFDSSDGCVGLATDDEMEKIAAWVRAAGSRTIELR